MRYVLAVVLTAIATLVQANCTYNGQTYPVGTRLGGLVCTERGWR